MNRRLIGIGLAAAAVIPGDVSPDETAPMITGHAIGPTPATRLMTALGSPLPEPLWRNRAVLTAMSRVAGPALRAGAVRLQGQVPSGQWFRVMVPRIWATTQAGATLHGEDLGPTGPAHPQRWLGGFALPNRGLFAIGTATFETYRPDRHLRVVPSASRTRD